MRPHGSVDVHAGVFPRAPVAVFGAAEERAEGEGGFADLGGGAGRERAESPGDHADEVSRVGGEAERAGGAEDHAGGLAPQAGALHGDVGVRGERAGVAVGGGVASPDGGSGVHQGDVSEPGALQVERARDAHETTADHHRARLDGGGVRGHLRGERASRSPASAARLACARAPGGDRRKTGGCRRATTKVGMRRPPRRFRK